jgi:RND family efflux transporter MFP subunit
MQDKLLTFFGKVKAKYRALTKKQRRMYIGGVVILFVVIFAIAHNKKETGTDTLVLAPQVLSRTVQVSGELTSDTDLSLGFEQSGTIKSTPVAVGKKVYPGTILATLSAGSESADVTKARGSLLRAEAEYNQARDITGGDEIADKELALENAKKDQDLLVDNAYRALLSNDLEAVPTDGDDDGGVPTISGSYTCDDQGTYIIELYSSAADSGASYKVSGLETGSGTVFTSASDNIGNCGLYITFPEDFSTSIDWEVAVPNTRSSTYITYKNAYDQAVQTRESTISQLESELATAKAQVETGDTKIAYANLVSAQGEYAAAVARLEETIIRAPSSGVVTKITKKPGESADMREEVVVLQDIDNLYVEAAVNESNIVGIKPGQKVAITFDALSEEAVYTGTVSDIDIAPTLEGDVTNYTITALIDTVDGKQDPILRPGMTANMTITLFQDAEILAIPRRAIIAGDDGWYVAVLDEEGNESQVKVTMGRDADGGLVEITSGLNSGDTIKLDTLAP